jgi:DNA polymerase
MQDSLFNAQPAESNETLDEINEELLRRAKSLPQYKERVFIFGEGAVGARVGVVGESPGPPDIESGRPFMGPAGLMLERILSSIGLARTDCYLTNVVKAICQGEEITPEWLSFFTPYLHRELAAARPRIVIAFGNTPTRALLRTKKPISQMRGEFQDYDGTPLMPTFNPAYLLRDPTKKREVWEDMKKIRALLATMQNQS